ncbi:MAG: type II toxin-antitoxin system RelE/ParE family toxin, partial [Gammaproteobacteria bacterium]
MIKSFADKDTEALFHSHRVRRLEAIQEPARRKLELLEAAAGLTFLRIPPGNRLEALSGRRKGQYSIRINDQWRVCFVWHKGDAHDVEIV